MGILVSGVWAYMEEVFSAWHFRVEKREESSGGGRNLHGIQVNSMPGRFFLKQGFFCDKLHSNVEWFVLSVVGGVHMNRILAFLLVIACIFAASGCKKEDTVTELSVPAGRQSECDSESIVTDASMSAGGQREKTWSEEEIAAMFSQVRKRDWEYVDCVLITDDASDCVGAVLFWDDAKQSSNVAFFDADGYFQQSGAYAKLPEDPDFTYLGDGSVTYKLEKEDGTIFDFTLTISTDGGNVQFIAEAEDETLK